MSAQVFRMDEYKRSDLRDARLQENERIFRRGMWLGEHLAPTTARAEIETALQNWRASGAITEDEFRAAYGFFKLEPQA